jgi:hypothetical protein
MLLLVPTLAWASVGYADPDRGTCVDAPVSAARPTPGDGDAGSAARQAAPAHQATPATTHGGGGDGELVLPRMRMPRWHSFLPGMFR